MASQILAMPCTPVSGQSDLPSPPHCLLPHAKREYEKDDTTIRKQTNIHKSTNKTQARKEETKKRFLYTEEFSKFVHGIQVCRTASCMDSQPTHCQKAPSYHRQTESPFKNEAIISVSAFVSASRSNFSLTLGTQSVTSLLQLPIVVYGLCLELGF